MSEGNLNNRILIVDDDETILGAFVQLMKLDGHETLIARNGVEALTCLNENAPDLVFMDISMPQMDGMATLKKIKETNAAIPIILITGYGTTETAIAAMQSGAFDYLTKPIEGRKIRELTKRALAHLGSSVSPENETVRNIRVKGTHDEMIGNSPAMQEVYKLIGSISSTPNQTSVLVLGESGTGKELVARAIHAYSANTGEPFVAINCTSLPDNLLESELFGHERGAFTGATERKIGKFEFAKNGTIFLDEIGDISAEIQKKLLRVLQERQCERLGSNQSIPVRARFIAATNRDLSRAVAENRFREDLFYRLNVATVTLPPLRERRDDIPILARYFVAKYNLRLGRNIRGFSNEAISQIRSLPFLGNVRELANLIERAVMVTKGDIIFPDALRDPAQSERSSDPSSIASSVFSKAREHALNMFERQFVQKLLRDCNGNVTVAARTSEMTRQNFQRLMKKHGVISDEFRD